MMFLKRLYRRCLMVMIFVLFATMIFNYIGQIVLDNDYQDKTEGLKGKLISKKKLVVELDSLLTELKSMERHINSRKRTNPNPNPNPNPKATLSSISKSKITNLEIKPVASRRKGNSTVEIQANGLNVHVWYGHCIEVVQDFCNFPMFPNAPDLREVANNLSIIRLNSSNFGQRVFGYLHPPRTDHYTFAIASNDSSALWISTNEDSNNSELIAFVGDKNKVESTLKGDFLRIRTQKSRPVLLEKGKKYFIEALHTEAGGGNFLQVVWQTPMSSFEIVPQEVFTKYFDDKHLNELKSYDHSIPMTMSCQVLIPTGKRNPYFAVQSLNYLEHLNVKNVLPTCSYSPSYIVRGRKLKKWEAFYHMIYYTNTYPLPAYKDVPLGSWLHKYIWLDERQAREVVLAYMGKLHQHQEGKYSLMAIRTVELKQDTGKGNNRYFIELDLKDNNLNKVVVLSEYVLVPRTHKDLLCYPAGLQWNRNADVFIVVTAHNQGRWVQHFINSLEKIFKETKDKHLHGVIFDYNSPDIDLEAAVRKSSFRQITILKKTAEKGFVKTEAYNEAVKSIKDPNAIIFLADLHLELASPLVDDIRKHTVQGKLVYTPILVRLDCGRSVRTPKGFWEAGGFGLVGIYKSDWDTFGGFNKHKQGWGGEDLDIADRIVEASLELERLPNPRVLHIHHKRNGMWKVVENL